MAAYVCDGKALTIKRASGEIYPWNRSGRKVNNAIISPTFICARETRGARAISNELMMWL